MPDREQAFFDEVGRLSYVPGFAKTTGTIRFDINHGDRTASWLLSINMGAISVSRDGGDADCVIHADEKTFLRMTAGETVPAAAYFSNEISVDGSFGLLVMLRYLFPGPPGAHDPRQLAEQDRRQS